MENISIFGMIENAESTNIENQSRILKAEEYKKYIDNHIKNVIRSYNNLIANDWINTPYNRDIKQELAALRNKIINHDASKYSDAEFDAFRAYLYPINDEEKENAKEDFEVAKKHHYKVNDHHPEHWIDKNGIPQDMPLICILELICDWDAMGYNTTKGYSSSAMDFWKKTRNTRWKDLMTEKTIITIDRLMKLMYYNED